MRVVLDTNVVVSALCSGRASPARILERWHQEQFELIVSEPILAEYRRVLGYEKLRPRHRLAERGIVDFVNELRRFAELVPVEISLAVITSDPSDNRFLECAVAGRADYIVSGDAHLLDLDTFQELRILAPAAFLLLLEHDR